ncbi:MAG: acetyl-CoA carboxylase biotin carboxylase subunit [Candidatus Kapaibacteriales bacterium]
MSKISKLLIANRGEIAIRIATAAHELGIKSVAVYHDVDKAMPFVAYCDEAYELSGDTPKAGYLDGDQIISIAKACGAQAIHPGYGFLSENADFAKQIEDEGLIFVGPPASSISAMGSKTEARKLMESAGVPTVPGHNRAFESDDEMKEVAKKIGYPVILKAAAGGGGKGMKLVEKEEDLVSEYNAARREAEKAFKDSLVYMEKYIVGPKHIEIQILGDKYGNYIHLNERDCSVQRRHQKVIEEAPSAVLTPEVREQMGKVAIDAARACGYNNAGTIEFLLDKNLDFYFLEMNTRLQVEHPVTEMITGVDLAKQQILIAQGEKLSYKQEDIGINGHAFEVRVYAEDAQNGFMPDIGDIAYMSEPKGPGVRIDTGIEWGSEIGLHFDPMLSKLIVHGNDREDALNRMLAALKSYKVLGFKTIIPFLSKVLQNDVFAKGWFDTGFLDKELDFESLGNHSDETESDMAAIAAYLFDTEKRSNKPIDISDTISNWKAENLLARKLV